MCVRMHVLCLEGCHGSGKTSVIDYAQMQSHLTFDENYIDMPPSALHPQSLTCEQMWVASWFKRILQAHADTENKGRVFFSDRSPFSAVLYAKNGSLLLPLIEHQIEELREIGIHVETVYLQVEATELWRRIQARLQVQPDRTRYFEHERSWMDQTVQWYEAQSWTHTLDTTHARPTDVFNTLKNLVAGKKIE